MSYKEMAKMQYRRDWAVDACQHYGIESQPCRDAVAIIEIQERNVQLSESMQAAMFSLSSYVVAFLFGFLCWWAMFNYRKHGPQNRGKTIMIHFLFYLGPLPFLLMMAISVWRILGLTQFLFF